MREIERLMRKGDTLIASSPGVVEHGAGQGLVACRFETFALVDRRT